MLRHPMCPQAAPLRTLPMGAERIGLTLNLSFVKLLKRGYAQRELMNPNDVYVSLTLRVNENHFWMM